MTQPLEAREKNQDIRWEFPLKNGGVLYLNPFGEVPGCTVRIPGNLEADSSSSYRQPTIQEVGEVLIEISTRQGYEKGVNAIVRYVKGMNKEHKIDPVQKPQEITPEGVLV